MYDGRTSKDWYLLFNLNSYKKKVEKYRGKEWGIPGSCG
jgi:hypothetical protein